MADLVYEVLVELWHSRCQCSEASADFQDWWWLTSIWFLDQQPGPATSPTPPQSTSEPSVCLLPCLQLILSPSLQPHWKTQPMIEIAAPCTPLEDRVCHRQSALCMQRERERAEEAIAAVGMSTGIRHAPCLKHDGPDPCWHVTPTTAHTRPFLHNQSVRRSVSP